MDLGTTYTAAAVNGDGRAEMLGRESGRWRPRSLGFVRDDGESWSARRPSGRVRPSWAGWPGSSSGGSVTPVPLLVGGSPYPAEAPTARLLAEVVGTATERQGGPLDHGA